jgi:hypothetical protein
MGAPAPHESSRFLYACASIEAIIITIIVSISVAIIV